MTSTDTVVTDPPVFTDNESAKSSRPLEIAFAVIALTLAAGYLYLGTQIELRRPASAGQIDARFWPLVLGTIGVAVSLVLLVIAITRPASSREDIEPVQRGGVPRVILSVAATTAFIVLWSLNAIVAFGYRIEIFPIIAAILMLVLLLVYGQRRWQGLVIFPLAMTAFIYVLFGMLLRVPL